MKKLTKILLLTILVASCNTTPHSNKDNPKEQETVMNDTTPKVTGIGGIFFYSKNPQEIREWYGKNLGLAIDDYGSPFEFRNANSNPLYFFVSAQCGLGVSSEKSAPRSNRQIP